MRTVCGTVRGAHWRPSLGPPRHQHSFHIRVLYTTVDTSHSKVLHSSFPNGCDLQWGSHHQLKVFFFRWNFFPVPKALHVVHQYSSQLSGELEVNSGFLKLCSQICRKVLIQSWTAVFLPSSWLVSVFVTSMFVWNIFTPHLETSSNSLENFFFRVDVCVRAQKWEK